MCPGPCYPYLSLLYSPCFILMSASLFTQGHHVYSRCPDIIFQTFLQPPPIGQPLPLTPCPGVAGDIPPSSSSSPPSLQLSASWPLPWLWPPLLFWLSELHALHDGLPLPFAVKGGTAPPPHAVIVSWCHLVKCQKGRGKT